MNVQLYPIPVSYSINFIAALSGIVISSKCTSFKKSFLKKMISELLTQEVFELVDDIEMVYLSLIGDDLIYGIRYYCNGQLCMGLIMLSEI